MSNTIANDLATRLCHIATTKFGNKDPECKDLTDASKELMRLDEAKGGKWCKQYSHWIAVNTSDCIACHLEKQNSKIFSIARKKILDILSTAQLIYKIDETNEIGLKESVANERKRCANANPIAVFCRSCEAEIGCNCIGVVTAKLIISFHDQRWRDAIMAYQGENNGTK